MSKTITFIIGAVVGLLLGGALAYYLFVGTPQALVKPGVPIQAPDANGSPVGTAQIVLKEDFFNAVLQTIFNDMDEPSFPLQLGSNQINTDPNATRYGLLQENKCESKIKLLQKGSDVQTSVLFENGKINAPLAFTGNANVLGSCYQFSGWAKANLELRFDKEKQIVYGVITVNTVNLDGVPVFAGGLITPLIQNALNQNVNPIEILNAKQLSVNLPITATNSNLQANISDVRAEVKEKSLNLFVTYDFAGNKLSNSK